MLSVVVLAKNEAQKITACLRSLQWCDEIIVIDDQSTDQTAALAKKHGAKVYQRPLNNDFAAQRNFGLSKARGEWVLFADADERISPALAAEIKQATSQKTANGFYLRRTDWLWGKPLKHGETNQVRLLRLAKKNAGRWQRQVHEIWQIKGRTDQLKNPLDHYPHQNLTSFVNHLNFHSTLHSQALQKEGRQANLLTIIILPSAKFSQNYCWRWGILDGMRGLIHALLMSWHSFFSQAKLYVKTH